MQRAQVIQKATKIAFDKGASVKFGKEGHVYVAHRERGDKWSVVAIFNADGEPVAITHKVVPGIRFRATPTAEPEEQEGLD